MPGSVENFITPANKFEGLYRLADDVSRRNERADLKIQRGQGRKDNLMDDLGNYTDQKNFFSGTPSGGLITKMLYDVKQKGAKLIQDYPNLDNSMLYTQLSNDIGKIANASKNLQILENQYKTTSEPLKKHSGIDQEKLYNEYYKNSLFNADGTMKDLDQINSLDTSKDYMDYTLKNSDVYNNAGFDQFAKESKSNTVVGSVKSTDPRGGMKRFRSELTSPNYTVSEKDAEGNHTGFVPKYDVATENGQPLLHEFENPDGTKTTAPIRLLDKSIMNDLPPDAKAYLLQEQRKYAKAHNVSSNSLQAENFARATAYDELNSPTKKWGTVKILEETKQPQIKVYNNNGRGAATDAEINDVYKGIDKTTQDPDAAITEKGTGVRIGTRFNKLNTDAQKVIVDFANAGRSEASKISPEQLFINNEDGEIKVYKTNDDGQPIPSEKNLLGTLPYTGTNLKVQPNAKAKVEVVKKGNLLQRAINKVTGKKPADPLGLGL